MGIGFRDCCAETEGFCKDFWSESPNVLRERGTVDVDAGDRGAGATNRGAETAGLGAVMGSTLNAGEYERVCDFSRLSDLQTEIVG